MSSEAILVEFIQRLENDKSKFSDDEKELFIRAVEEFLKDGKPFLGLEIIISLETALGDLSALSIKLRQTFGYDYELEQLLERVLEGFFSKNETIKPLDVLEIYSNSSSGLIFRFGDLFTEYFKRTKLESREVLDVFPILLTAVSKDMAANRIWENLTAFCEKNPSESVNLLNFYSTQNKDLMEPICASILGKLRSLFRSESQLEFSFEEVESTYQSGNDIQKSIYLQSWITTLWEGSMKHSDYSIILALVNAHPFLKVKFSQLLLSCTYNSKVPKLADEAKQWLRDNASNEISDIEKHHLIEMISNEELHMEDHEVYEILNSLLPLSEEVMGTWERLQPYLVRLLQSNKKGFEEAFTCLCCRSAEFMQNALFNRNAEWLLGEMNQLDATTLVTSFILDEKRSARKIGHKLLNEFKLQKLDLKLIEEKLERNIELLFYELILEHHEGSQKGVILYSVCKYVSEKSPLFSELKKELFRQTISTHSCRTFLSSHKDIAIIETAIEKAERYFKLLDGVKESDIGQMQIKGSYCASRAWQKKMNRSVDKGMKEASSFIDMFAQVVIPYGKTSVDYNAGNFSEELNMQEFSHSSEIPLSEILDPESRVLRRMEAQYNLEIILNKS